MKQTRILPLGVVGVVVGAMLVVLALADEAFQPSDDDLHRRSENFWSALAVEGVWAESYDSLEGLFAHSDVVVVGRLVSVEGGRVFGTPNPLLDHPEESQFFFASIQVESLQLLRGAPILDSDGYIVLEELLPERSRLDTLVTNLPEGRAVFFLRNKGVDAMSQGRSRAIVERDTPFYRRITPQGVLRDIGGDVHIPVDGGGGFLLTLEGTGFDALLKRLETLPS